MNEVIREFLLETQENLAQLDTDLIALEKDPHEHATLARVFRNLHTVKGSAGFLGLGKLQGVAHAAESLLSRLRAGELSFNAEIATALLKTIDAIRQMLINLEAELDEGTGDYSDLIRELDDLREGIPTTPQQVVPPPPLQPPPVPQPSLVASQMPSQSLVAEPTEVRGSVISDSSIRVDVGLLDKLMTLVGELVLARNQVMQFSSSQEDAAFLGTVQRLNLLTTELQAGVMKTRMQPIGNIWGKFPRIVRDLAIACDKQVRIDMDGQETELDKTIVEAIRDPLTHMVRNAVDHGIERPAVRERCGKPAEGRLTLRAFHEGGKVIIEIADDGGGIDPIRVRDKAIAVKALSTEEASHLSERELVNLIFLPGFSTADKVTHFSGRGVGMDVVRTNIEHIGGTVELESRPGLGTTVKMKIPLTLAIIPALTISSGGERFAIPQVNLLELVRLEHEQLAVKIETIHGFPVYRLRGNLLPLVYLDRELQLTTDHAAAGALHIVVLQADDQKFGLIVDAIHDTEEIVVKPLQKQIKNVGVFAGATIMGDGRVALILDVLGIAQRAHVVTEARMRGLGEKTGIVHEATVIRQSLLLFTTRDGSRLAMPLARVARLEEFPRNNLERTGDRFVVQYLGEIMPLFDVARVLRSGQRRTQTRRRTAQRTRVGNECVSVVVVATATQPIGFIVAHILDIVDEEITATAPATRVGVLHTAIVQGRVTEFLDVDSLLSKVVSDIGLSQV